MSSRARLTAPSAQLTLELVQQGQARPLALEVSAKAPAHPLAARAWAGYKLHQLAAPFSGALFTMGVSSDVKAFASSLTLPFCGPNLGFEPVGWLTRVDSGHRGPARRAGRTEHRNRRVRHIQHDAVRRRRALRWPVQIVQLRTQDTRNLIPGI